MLGELIQQSPLPPRVKRRLWFFEEEHAAFQRMERTCDQQKLF
jgi:hypothetical protein